MRDSGRWSSLASGKMVTLILMLFIPWKGTRSQPVRNTKDTNGLGDDLRLRSKSKQHHSAEKPSEKLQKCLYIQKNFFFSSAVSLSNTSQKVKMVGCSAW